MTVEEKEKSLKHAVETLLFIADSPVPLSKLCTAVGESDEEKVRSVVQDLQREYAERAAGVQVLDVAGGWQMATKPEYAAYVRALYKDKMTMRLSTAALETLSIISYKQPITRAEVEAIRGVEVIAALETLLEKNLVKVVGRKESVGRPLLYGTTHDFLRQFGLRSTDDLPPIEDFETPQVHEPLPEGERSGETDEPSGEETAGSGADSAEDAGGEDGPRDEAPPVEEPSDEPSAEEPREEPSQEEPSDEPAVDEPGDPEPVREDVDEERKED